MIAVVQTRRYPCGCPACAGCQDDPSGAACDYAAGHVVRPPAARDRPHTHERAGTGAHAAWGELAAVRAAVGE